jgi:hypothetical protein
VTQCLSNPYRVALALLIALDQKAWVLRKLLYGMHELEVTEFLID